MATVGVIATCDTKGREAAFLREQIAASGTEAIVIDTGVREPVEVAPDIIRVEIARAAGTSIEALLKQNDRGRAVAAMGKGLAVLLKSLVSEGKLQGVIGIGGSGGTSISAAGMRELPIGFPKLIVSTLAAADTRAFIGTKDITMTPSVVDVEGLNRISIPILTNAAAAIVGMANAHKPEMPTRPLVGVTMFGVTTPCVKQACAILDEAGYETVVFHAVGTGGQTVETLIEEGFFDGVLDVTTTEWCDEHVGGILSAGPSRLDAAAKTGTPQVVCPGALDMVNFGSVESVPDRFRNRNLYVHNPQVTLMRTTADESREIARIIADKLNASTGPVTLCLPLRGVSAIDAVGQPFDDPAARHALFDTFRECIDPNRVELVELDLHINDEAFSRAIAERLLTLINK